MRFGMAFLIALVVPLPLEAQTINGESNYEDGFSHITPDEADSRLRENAKKSKAKGETQVEDRARAADMK